LLGGLTLHDWGHLLVDFHQFRKAVLEIVLFNDSCQNFICFLFSLEILKEYLDTLHECNLIILLEADSLHQGDENIHLSQDLVGLTLVEDCSEALSLLPLDKLGKTLDDQVVQLSHFGNRCEILKGVQDCGLASCSVFLFVSELRGWRTSSQHVVISIYSSVISILRVECNQALNIVL